MDPPYALHGHPRSMSCPYPAAPSTVADQAVSSRGGIPLHEEDSNGATALMTILPLSLDDSDWRPAPPRQLSARHGADEALRASQVPLPPSVAGSEHGSHGSSQEKDISPKVAPRRPSAEAQIPPPASIKTQDTASMQPPLEKQPTEELQPIQAPSQYAKEHWLDADQVPLPPSVAGSEYDRPSLSHSRRTSLLSTRSQDHPAQEDPPLQPETKSSVEALPETTIKPADTRLQSFENVMSLVQCTINERARNVGLQQELLWLLCECGSQSRGLGMQSYLYKGLVECFRLEKKPAFATLFDQMEASKAISPSGMAERRSDSLATSRVESTLPWISTLPTYAQPALLKFLNNLRTNPLFLAERISALNNSQLKNLAKPHLPTGRADSSTESSPNPRLDLRLLRPWMRTSSSGIESLPQDPLRLMILNCFDSTSNQGYSERQRLLDVWSTACARLIEDQRMGSNEFCFAVLEILADLTPWELGPKLELFLMELMHTGRFITSSTSHVSGAKDFPEPTESSIPAFFDSAVDALLDVVTGSAPFSVPTVSLHLIHATLQKLDDPQKTARARRFFVYTWYCNTFLSSALLYPERHHLLLNVHISPVVRQKLLRELASRFQKTVRDVLDPRSTQSPTGSEAKVAKLLSIFDEKSGAQEPGPAPIPFERPYVALFAEDVLAIAKALYPNDPSESGDKPPTSEPTSPPSSVTGSSTLTAGTNELRSGINSAFTPSVSGTSVTSHTLSSDFFIKSPDKSTDKTMGTGTKSRPGTSASLDGLDDIPVHSFLSELWKLCASRKSSNSPPPTVESSIFFVETPSGHLCSQTSRSLDGDLQVHGPVAEFSDSLASKDTQIVMRALSKASDKGFHRHPAVLASSDVPSSFNTLFRLYLDQARCQHDFQASFFWFHALRALTNLASNLETSMSDLCTRYAAAIQEYTSGSQRYQEWIHSLQTLRAGQHRRLQHAFSHGAALRTKMWYVTDVRHSDVYEHTVNIVRALHNMSKPPAPQQHGVAAWARQRLRVSWGHEKAQAQAFQLVSAAKSCGGPNKLTDDQSEQTSRWLTRESIENFCGGEERVHRFCFEIQRCATKLVGASMSESPVLWSSPLFSGGERSKGFATKSRFEKRTSSLEVGKSHPPDLLHPASGLFSRKGGLGFAFERASHDVPQLGQDHLADPFTEKGARSRRGSGLPAAALFPPSPISPEGDLDRMLEKPTSAFVDHLRQSIVALLVSDLGVELWGDGSETDGWINHEKTPLSTAAESLQGDVRSAKGAGVDSIPMSEADPLTFDFEEGYRKLLTIFKYSLDPQQKLQALYELSILAECQCISASEPASEAFGESDDLPSGLRGLVAQARGVPRIRLTRLQEVVANCNERRQTSRASAVDASGLYDLLPGTISSTPRDISNALAIVSTLFLDEQYRPATLFRDLQLIASFVPSATLDRTPHGTVFWTVGLVAMGLKSETCKIMTRRATEIVDYHVNSTNNRSKEPTRGLLTSGAATADPTLTDAELASTTLADAARFYLLSALEGEPSAARELALFYLTHPELVRPAMLPLTRPGEVLRSINLLGGSGERKSHDGPAGVLDPPTFAIAYHWMEFAANAGDADAQTFLLENRELAGGV